MEFVRLVLFPEEVKPGTARQLARINEEIIRCVGLSGFTVNFRAWGKFEKFIPMLWDLVRPCVGAAGFQDASDAIRMEALLSASNLRQFNDELPLPLSESAIYQLKSGLDFYSFMLPQLLIAVSTLRLALSDSQNTGEQTMPAEGVGESLTTDRFRDLFEAVQKTIPLSSPANPFKTSKIWSRFFEMACLYLAPLCQSHSYNRMSSRLGNLAGRLAENFVEYLAPAEIERGTAFHSLLEKIIDLEKLLPSLIVQVSMLQLSWKPAEFFQKVDEKPSVPCASTEDPVKEMNRAPRPVSEEGNPRWAWAST